MVNIFLILPPENIFLNTRKILRFLYEEKKWFDSVRFLRMVKNVVFYIYTFNLFSPESHIRLISTALIQLSHSMRKFDALTYEKNPNPGK